MIARTSTSQRQYEALSLDGAHISKYGDFRIRS